MTNETRPADPAARDMRDEKPPRFIEAREAREARRVPLSNLQTEDEARLAAEIEKLLG